MSEAVSFCIKTRTPERFWSWVRVLLVNEGLSGGGLPDAAAFFLNLICFSLAEKGGKGVTFFRRADGLRPVVGAGVLFPFGDGEEEQHAVPVLPHLPRPVV